MRVAISLIALMALLATTTAYAASRDAFVSRNAPVKEPTAQEENMGKNEDKPAPDTDAQEEAADGDLPAADVDTVKPIDGKDQK